ncbi:uncharacterized protein LOC128231942 isoform X2 [Mya arenaria]|nr:uncharacterized protein LOC128231942 isoform X2 [Mya arenaria]XP_052801169.1 uncharacterized protein LOC128231942 isoform X2 [Mya arenaria]
MDSSIDSSADMNFSDIDDCLDLTDTTLECDRSVVQTNNDATGSDDEVIGVQMKQETSTGKRDDGPSCVSGTVVDISADDEKNNMLHDIRNFEVDNDMLDPDVIVIRDEPPDDAAAENSVELLEDYEEEADEEVGLTLLSGRSKKGKALMRGKTKVKATDKQSGCISTLEQPHVVRGKAPELLKKVIPPPEMECGGCSMMINHFRLVECCEGHLVCNDCVKRTTKDVLMGKMQGSVSCPKPDCSSSVPMSELRKVHESLIIELLEDKWQKDTLDALEKMSDVIKCPGCGLSQVLDVEVKQYKCAGCSKSYCRHCNREWGDRSHDLCISTKKWESSFSGKVINIPAYWCDPPLNQSYSLIVLPVEAVEFTSISQLMYKNMHCNVVRIYRVQNHKMWEKYSVTRSHMIEDLGERTTNETRLYHGTDIQTIGAICEEGFDLRMSGKNACLFGDGVYFANSAAFSHKYAAMGRSRSKSQAIGSAAGIAMLQAMFGGYTGASGGSFGPPPTSSQSASHTGFQSIAHTSPGIHLSSTVKPVNPVPTTQITFTQAYPLGIPFSTTGAHSLSAFNPQVSHPTSAVTPSSKATGFALQITTARSTLSNPAPISSFPRNASSASSVPNVNPFTAVRSGSISSTDAPGFLRSSGIDSVSTTSVASALNASTFFSGRLSAVTSSVKKPGALFSSSSLSSSSSAASCRVCYSYEKGISSIRCPFHQPTNPSSPTKSAQSGSSFSHQHNHPTLSPKMASKFGPGSTRDAFQDLRHKNMDRILKDMANEAASLSSGSVGISSVSLKATSVDTKPTMLSASGAAGSNSTSKTKESKWRIKEGIVYKCNNGTYSFLPSLGFDFKHIDLNVKCSCHFVAKYVCDKLAGSIGWSRLKPSSSSHLYKKHPTPSGTGDLQPNSALTMNASSSVTRTTTTDASNSSKTKTDSHLGHTPVPDYASVRQIENSSHGGQFILEDAVVFKMFNGSYKFIPGFNFDFRKNNMNNKCDCHDLPLYVCDRLVGRPGWNRNMLSANSAMYYREADQTSQQSAAASGISTTSDSTNTRTLRVDFKPGFVDRYVDGSFRFTPNMGYDFRHVNLNVKCDCHSLPLYICDGLVGFPGWSKKNRSGKADSYMIKPGTPGHSNFFAGTSLEDIFKLNFPSFPAAFAGSKVAPGKTEKQSSVSKRKSAPDLMNPNTYATSSSLPTNSQEVLDSSKTRQKLPVAASSQSTPEVTCLSSRKRSSSASNVNLTRSSGTEILSSSIEEAASILTSATDPNGLRATDAKKRKVQSLCSCHRIPVSMCKQTKNLAIRHLNRMQKLAQKQAKYKSSAIDPNCLSATDAKNRTVHSLCSCHRIPVSICKQNKVIVTGDKIQKLAQIQVKPMSKVHMTGDRTKGMDYQHGNNTEQGAIGVGSGIQSNNRTHLSPAQSHNKPASQNAHTPTVKILTSMSTTLPSSATSSKKTNATDSKYNLHKCEKKFKDEHEAMEVDYSEVSAAGTSTLFNEKAAHDSGDYFMFVARVLIGRTSKGKQGLRRPEKNGQGELTHTAVNDIKQPNIFVVFDNTQCYPEYLIQYSANADRKKTSKT